MVDPPLCRAVPAGSGAQYGQDDFQHHSNKNGGRGNDGMVLVLLGPLIPSPTSPLNRLGATHPSEEGRADAAGIQDSTFIVC